MPRCKGIISKEPDPERCWAFWSAEHFKPAMAEVTTHNYFYRHWNSSPEPLENMALAEEHVFSTKSECSIGVNCHWRGIKWARSKYGACFIPCKHFSLWICDRLCCQSAFPQYFISYVNEIQMLSGVYPLLKVLVSLRSFLSQDTWKRK